MPTPAEKTYTPAIRQSFLDFKKKHGHSLTQLERITGINGTQLSRYLAGKPTGEVSRIEAIIKDVVHHDEKAKDFVRELFETAITRQVATSFERIRSTNDVGLVCSPAGLGKTSAIDLYCANWPAAVRITINIRQNNPKGIEQLIWRQINTSSWRRQVSRWEFLCDHFDRSNRLFIVDNANELTSYGRKWFFHFHDQTNCPVALVGNPEILDDIDRDRSEDQQSTRIGYKPEIRWRRPEQIRNAVSQILDSRMSKRQAGSVFDLACKIADEKGHLRALKKQIDTALIVIEKGVTTNMREAFLIAHETLIRNYDLPA